MMEKFIFNNLNQNGKKFFQLFTRFLKENNYFYRYKKAFENSKRLDKINKLKICCNTTSPNIVDRTLYWANTEEGFDYWKNVNIQFENLCAIIFK